MMKSLYLLYNCFKRKMLMGQGVAQWPRTYLACVRLGLCGHPTASSLLQMDLEPKEL